MTMKEWIYEPSPWVEFYSWAAVVGIIVIVVGAMIGLGIAVTRDK